MSLNDAEFSEYKMLFSLESLSNPQMMRLKALDNQLNEPDEREEPDVREESPWKKAAKIGLETAGRQFATAISPQTLLESELGQSTGRLYSGITESKPVQFGLKPRLEIIGRPIERAGEAVKGFFPKPPGPPPPGPKLIASP